MEKKSVQLEIEIDPVTKDRRVNRYQKWIDLAQAVDSWRFFPRLFLTIYIVLLYKSTVWFMELPAPSMEQAGLISIIVGAGGAWFGLYAGTTTSSKSFNGDK